MAACTDAARRALAALCLVAGLASAVEPTCRITPYREIRVSSPATVLILKLHAARGDRVRPGQLLVELDTADLDAALAAAEYQAAMRGPVRSAELRLEAVRAAADAAGDRHAVQLAEAELQTARETKKLAGLEAARLRQQKAGRRLLSPIDGVVAELRLTPGELATADTAILTLHETRWLRAEARLPMALFGRLRIGSRIPLQALPPAPDNPALRIAPTLESLGLPDIPDLPTAPRPPATGPASVLARVIGMERSMDGAGLFTVHLDLPNLRGEILVGAECRVTTKPFERLELRPAGRE